MSSAPAKKYQVFISSTFTDLKTERLAALNAILQMNHIPAGMELFPANDASPWEHIQSVIAQSDYYLLIVGGRYGSQDDSGLGFTEKEYDFAFESGLPIVALLHSRPEVLKKKLIDVGELWTKLQLFRAKVDARHTRNSWSTAKELQSKLVTSLHQQFHSKPRRGWVRADESIESTATKDANPTQAENNNPIEANDAQQPSSTDINRSAHDHFIALYECAERKNLSEVQAIFDARHARLDDPMERTEWEAAYEYVLLTTNIGGNLKKLMAYSERSPDNMRIKQFLAWIYSDYGEHKTSARYFEVAASITASAADKLGLLTQAFKKHHLQSDFDNCRRVAEEIRLVGAADTSAFEHVLKSMQTIGELEGKDVLYFTTSEKLLALNPTNHELRFQLAYKYSQAGSDNLAHFHYLRIPDNLRTGLGWNNLGVAQEKLKLTSQSIESYRQAAVKGDTLASSNLAYRYIEAGFLSDSEAICNAALQQSDPVEQLHQAITRLKQIPKEEQVLRDQLIREASPYLEFCKEFGSAVAQPGTGSIDGTWQAPECNVLLKVSNDVFQAIGEYTTLKSSNLLADRKEPSIHELRIEGKIDGRTAIGTVKRGEKGHLSNSLLSLGEKTLFIISEDGNLISAAEKTLNAGYHFFTLQKVSARPPT